MAQLVPRVCSAVFRDEQNAYTFIWKVQYCPENKIHCIVSPGIFFVPDASWRIKLFLKGNQISLHFVRCNRGPDAVVVDFELALLSLCDLPQRVKICRNYTFAKGDTYLYEDFFTLSDYTMKCVPLWFPNNSLTIRCRVWYPKLEIPILFFFSTSFSKERTTYNWRISNYLSLQQFEIRYNNFPSVMIGVIPFTLELVTTAPESTDVSHVRLSLQRADILVLKVGRITCTISQLNVDGEWVQKVTKDGPAELWWFQNYWIWEIPYELSKEKLIATKKTSLPENALTLRFEIEFWVVRAEYSDMSMHKPSLNKHEYPIQSDVSNTSTPENSPGNLNSRFLDSSFGHGDSTGGNSVLGDKDSVARDSAIVIKNSPAGSPVQGSSLVNKDSPKGHSTLGQDSAAGDSTLVSKDTSAGDFGSGPSGTVKSWKSSAKRKRSAKF